MRCKLVCVNIFFTGGVYGVCHTARSSEANSSGYFGKSGGRRTKNEVHVIRRNESVGIQEIEFWHFLL